jgi:hypothetical protein
MHAAGCKRPSLRFCSVCRSSLTYEIETNDKRRTYPPFEHPACTKEESVLIQTSQNDAFSAKGIWINAPWTPVKFPAGCSIALHAIKMSESRDSLQEVHFAEQSSRVPVGALGHLDMWKQLFGISYASYEACLK